MTKAILEFDLDKEREKFDMHLKGPELVSALKEIRNEVFRPARKHGYANEAITDLINEIGREKAETLIHFLEEEFNDIIESNELDSLV